MGHAQNRGSLTQAQFETIIPINAVSDTGQFKAKAARVAVDPATGKTNTFTQTGWTAQGPAFESAASNHVIG